MAYVLIDSEIAKSHRQVVRSFERGDLESCGSTEIPGRPLEANVWYHNKLLAGSRVGRVSRSSDSLSQAPRDADLEDLLSLGDCDTSPSCAPLSRAGVARRSMSVYSLPSLRTCVSSLDRLRVSRGSTDSRRCDDDMAEERRRPLRLGVVCGVDV